MNSANTSTDNISSDVVIVDKHSIDLIRSASLKVTCRFEAIRTLNGWFMGGPKSTGSQADAS